jgi:hypothetical protein
MAAALAAARAGAEVTLIEAKPRLGGTVTHALIHTLGGFLDSAGELLNPGLPAELAGALLRADAAGCRRRMGRLWVLNVCPDVYAAVVQGWIDAEPRIRVRYQARVTRLVRGADRVEELEGAEPAGTFRLRVRAVIDATGTAEVVRGIAPALVEDDPQRAAGGLIFQMHDLAPGTLAFPRGLQVVRALRDAAAMGHLPRSCANAWVDTGVHENEAYVKLFVPLAGDWRGAEARADFARRALEEQAAVAAFLRQQPGFAQARIGRVGELGVRDGGRIRGEYCLTVEDVRRLRRFADAAGRCGWPIEFWDPEQGVSVEHLPEAGYYEIPLRALKVQGLANVWAAGKCLSADRHAQASARVVGSCWAMGEAVGRAAAGRE